MVLAKKSGKKNSCGPSKPIDQYTADGIYIRSFFSLSEATKITGVNNISKCLIGKHLKAGGYRWTYKGQDLSELEYIKPNGRKKYGYTVKEISEKLRIPEVRVRAIIKKFNKLIRKNQTVINLAREYGIKVE